MKALFFILLLGATAAFGQAKAPTADKPKTDLEVFQAKYGVVIVQGYSKTPAITGLGGSFQITVEEYRDATTSSKVKGLLVEVDSGEKYSNPARSFVEYGEIESLIKGITYISKIDKSVTTLEQFEAEYKTKGDFSVTVFNNSNNKLSVSIAVGSIGRKSVYLDIERLPDLIAALQKAKTTLDSL